MAKCEVCSKGQHFGLMVSHSHRKSNHAWKPNVKKIHLEVDGQNPFHEHLRQMPACKQDDQIRLIVPHSGNNC